MLQPRQVKNLSGINWNLSKIQISMIFQNAAISFVACIDNKQEKIKQLVATLEKDYTVLRNENVGLLTVRHHTPEILNDLTRNRYILLEQKTRKTVQVVLK